MEIDRGAEAQGAGHFTTAEERLCVGMGRQ
jgi:hypothetical protein